MNCIHILTKLGLIFLGLSVAAWLFISRWSSNTTLDPLSAPISTSEGAHFSQSFDIPSAENYYISVVCLAVGPLESKDDIDFEKQYKKIPCDMYITLSRKGNVVSKRRVGFLDRGALWDGKVRYYLLDVDIDKPGPYELTIDNQKDLSFLNPTEPQLKVSFSPSSRETDEMVRALLPSYCLRLGVVALILIGFGLMLGKSSKKRKDFS